MWNLPLQQPWCPWGSFHPTPRKSFPHPHMCPSPQPLSHKVLPPVPIFVDLVEGGRNYTKIPLSSGEEKHVDTYIDKNTTKNKTGTTYSKEVS